MCRVWMIYFWMVKNHYPDRVMRQFNLFQQIPPATPIDYQQVLTYRKNKHTLGGGEGQNVDWGAVLLAGTRRPQDAYHGVATV
jgi:hypothetical protein